MSAQEHLNSRQFDLFKKVPGGTAQVPLWAHAHDITTHPMAGFVDYDEGVHDSLDDLRYEKLTESQYERIHEVEHDGKTYPETLYDNIEREGIRKPVTLDLEDHGVLGVAPVVRGGHHRLFSAEDLDEQRDGAGGRINRIMVPLRYDDKTERFHGSWE